MRITCNEAKNRSNKQKHGVFLAEANSLDWDILRAKQDERGDYGAPYGESRMIGHALRGRRLYCVVYTDHQDERRLISLRKANKREVIAYAGSKR